MATPKKPEWTYYTHVWKTESAYLTWLRGQIRRIWSKCPQKLEILKSHEKRLPKYDSKGEPIKYKNGKARLYKAFLCNYCETICYDCDRVGGKKTYEVDHVKGNHTLTKFEHVEAFLEGVLKPAPEDLQILCKSCHDIKTYAEKEDVTFKEAFFQKMAIKILKDGEDKQFFTDRSLDVPKNKALRREGIIKILKSEN